MAEVLMVFSRTLVLAGGGGVTIRRRYITVRAFPSMVRVGLAWHSWGSR